MSPGQLQSDWMIGRPSGMAIGAEPTTRLTRAIDVFGRSWAGRRAAVVGLGKSGMAAAELLCRIGCRVRASDAQDTSHLQAAKTSLRALGVEEVELGGHTPHILEGAEVVVVSPGVPEATGPIRWAIEHQLPIVSEIELAFQFCPSPIIAVTGTNGKSTTVTLIAELLKTCGRPAVACGNLGIPFSSVIPQLTPQTIAVVEVSSFQLLWCSQLRPKIAVLLNIGTNHLDRHQEKSAYLAAKARLFQQQTPADWAVLNGTDPHVVALSEHLRARCVWFGENRSNAPALWLASETQRSLTLSAQAILQVARILEVPDPLTWQVIRSFRGLEPRLEYVAAIHGVHFVNDSKSTTPDSLLYALSQTRGDVVVIVGGRDKGLDFGPLIEPLHDERIKGIVLMGESRARLRPMLNGSTIVRESPTLEDAMHAATSLATPGATVLFSPACASFDMFKNFEERGAAFKALLSKMESS